MKKQSSYISNPFKVIFTGLGNLFKYNQNLTIILLIASLLGTGGSYIPGDPWSVNSDVHLSNDQIRAIFIGIAVAVLILLPIVIFLTTMYNGLAAYTALKTSQNKTVTFGEAWKLSLNKFWTILGINIIVGLKVLGGLLLFIVPGIRAAMRYNMVHMHIFDQNAGVKDSISRAKALTKDHLIEIFGMTFAAAIIPVVGGILGIGGQSVMYSQLTALKSSKHQKPSVHWLNYLAFIIAIVVVLLIILATIALITLVKNI